MKYISMECSLSPRRLRTLFTCVSFGAVLLWILLGAYVRPSEPAAAAAAQAGLGLGRHLLSSAEELGGKSAQDCDNLAMVYTPSGKQVHPVDVNTKDDQVSELASASGVRAGRTGVCLWPTVGDPSDTS